MYITLTYTSIYTYYIYTHSLSLPSLQYIRIHIYTYISPIPPSDLTTPKTLSVVSLFLLRRTSHTSLYIRELLIANNSISVAPVASKASIVREAAFFLTRADTATAMYSNRYSIYIVMYMYDIHIHRCRCRWYERV